MGQCGPSEQFADLLGYVLHSALAFFPFPSHHRLACPLHGIVPLILVVFNDSLDLLPEFLILFLDAHCVAEGPSLRVVESVWCHHGAHMHVEVSAVSRAAIQKLELLRIQPNSLRPFDFSQGGSHSATSRHWCRGSRLGIGSLVFRRIACGEAYFLLLVILGIRAQVDNVLSGASALAIIPAMAPTGVVTEGGTGRSGLELYSLLSTGELRLSGCQMKGLVGEEEANTPVADRNCST